jgi:CheY-like chemotaxis protein
MNARNGALRIVVVDDNYDANIALSRLLKASGFEVVGRAYDGLSGLSLVKAEKPDVAILDLAMPALDGLGLARRIREEMDLQPRLVALTSFGPELASEAESAGFDSYVCKPANWLNLKQLLESYLP